MSNNTKHQHYIPVFLLKNWCTIDEGRSSKIWSYMIKNKQNNKVSIESICYQNNLHEGSLPTNLIENNLATFWEPLWKNLIDKILNHQELTNEELSGTIIMFSHFLLRSPYFIKNLSKELNITKETYLVNSLALVTKNGNVDKEYNKILLNFSQHLLNTFKYVYFGYTTKFFVINDLMPITICNCRNPKDDNWLNQDLYFPISNNICLIITNKIFDSNNNYILLENDYVNWINEQFINMKEIRFIYSKDCCSDYIERHKYGGEQ